MSVPSLKGRCWIVFKTSSGGIRGEIKKFRYGDGSGRVAMLCYSMRCVKCKIKEWLYACMEYGAEER